MKLVNYLKFWFDSKKSKRIKLKTYWVYNDYIRKYINPHLGSNEIEKISSSTLNDFIDFLHEKRLSKSSISIILSIIKNVINDYYENELNRLNQKYNLFIPLNQKKTRSIYYY